MFEMVEEKATMNVNPENAAEGKKNFFAISPRFPIVKDGQFETSQFLEAAGNLVTIYDYLGKTFYLVKKDMEGNVNKLSKVYNKQPEKYKLMGDLILHEKDDPSLYAIDALLWLRRGLQFIVIFMMSLINDPEKNEDIAPFVSVAYEKTLKPYHSYLLQKVFEVIVKAFPGRSGVLKAIYKGENGPEEPALKEGCEYMSELELNLKVISDLYDHLNLNDNKKA